MTRLTILHLTTILILLPQLVTSVSGQNTLPIFENGPVGTEIGDSLNGQRIGIWYEFVNGQPSAKGIYKNNKKDSVWTFYGANINKPKKESVKDFKKAKVCIRINYQNGKYNGKWISFFPENGRVREEREYRNDTLIGKRIEYYSNSNIFQIIRYDSLSNNFPYVIQYKSYFKSGRPFITYENFYNPDLGKPAYDHKTKKIILNNNIDNYDLEKAEGDYKTYTDGKGLWEEYVIVDGRKKYLMRYGKSE